MRYYGSARGAAAALGLELLARADADTRSISRQERLSGYAADARHAGHLYHRLLARLGATSLQGKVICVVGPWGTLEHLPWAVGLADRAASEGQKAFLLAPGADFPFASAGAPGGLALPPEIEERRGAWLSGDAFSVPTDIAGVRIVVPGAPQSASATNLGGRWCLIVADVGAEALEGPYRLPAGIDATLLVAAFRDHGVYELEQIVRGLRAAGHRLAGMVAVGPEQVDEVEADPPAPLVVQAPEPDPEPLPEPAPARDLTPEPEAAPAPEPAPEPALEPAPEPAPALVPEPETTIPEDAGLPRPVPLFTLWQKETRRGHRARALATWVVVPLLAVLAGAFLWPRRDRIKLPWPPRPQTVAPAPAPAPSDPDVGEAVIPDTVGLTEPAPRGAAWLPEDLPAGTRRVVPAVEADSTAGPAAADTFVVHLSSFRLLREAEAEVARLAGEGIPARGILVDVPGKGPWYRVVTGHFATFAEAEATALRLCRTKGVAVTHVASEGGRGRPVPVDSLAGVPPGARPRTD